MCFVNPFLSLQSSHDIIQNQQKRKMHNTFDLTEDKTANAGHFHFCRAFSKQF